MDPNSPWLALCSIALGRVEPEDFDPGYPVRTGGSTVMWKSMLDEAREVVWLASVIGGLSAVGVGMAVVLAAT